jgi:hypothetical protein
MKHHLQAITLIASIFAILAATAGFAADTKDQMIGKIVGQDKATSAPPYAIAAHAMVGKDNSIAINAWSGSLVVQGATFDRYSTTLAFVDPTANRTITFPNASGTVALNPTGASWEFEGATADDYETTLTVTDPTADRTITVPNASGTVTLAQASTTTALTADDQAVTPGSNTRLQLTSDNGTAANRTFTLSATGAITGQIYVLIGPASNQCELADTGIQKLSAAWSPGPTDTLTLLFDGTNFIELCRADN